MQVQITDASDLVDRFEERLAAHGVSIPGHASTDADMLSLWRILKQIKAGFSGTPDDMRRDYTAGLAVHDLAAKVLAVEGHPDFPALIPHLGMLAQGAIHLTQEPPADADTYNKLVEVYWAALLMAKGTRIQLDHPKSSKGDNPDVIALNGEQPAHAFAFKTVRSPHTQSILDHLIKGVDQIERCAAPEGIVAFNLTPRLLGAEFWPENGFFDDWRQPAVHTIGKLSEMIFDVLKDNGQEAIDDVCGKEGSRLHLVFSVHSDGRQKPHDRERGGHASKGRDARQPSRGPSSVHRVVGGDSRSEPHHANRARLTLGSRSRLRQNDPYREIKGRGDEWCVRNSLWTITRQQDN